MSCAKRTKRLFLQRTSTLTLKRNPGAIGHVASSPAKAARFPSFLKKSKHGGWAPNNGLAVPHPHAQGTKPRIMVVEDDRHVGPLLQTILERSGFDVTLFTDGRIAALFIDSAISPPCLMLLEIMVSYADGFQMIGHVRGRAGWEAVPIVMLSTCSREDDIVRAFDCGADDYVVKPFQPKELVARVRRLLRAQRP